MKQVVRTGVFETNSSSTHSLTIASKEDYEAWKRGDLLFEKYNQKFVSATRVTDDIGDWTEKYLEKYSQKLENGYVYHGKYYSTMDELKNSVSVDIDTLNRFVDIVQSNTDNERYTYQKYCDSIRLESFTEEYTTKSGDGVVVFGYYGYD